MERNIARSVIFYEGSIVDESPTLTVAVPGAEDQRVRCWHCSPCGRWSWERWG